MSLVLIQGTVFQRTRDRRHSPRRGSSGRWHRHVPLAELEPRGGDRPDGVRVGLTYTVTQ